MKKLLVTTLLFVGLQLSHAQYFDGSHPGVPLLGKNGPLDGGSITNVATTNLVGTLGSALTETNNGNIVFTNNSTYFDPKGAAAAITNGAPTSVVTNGLGSAVTNRTFYVNGIMTTNIPHQ